MNKTTAKFIETASRFACTYMAAAVIRHRPIKTGNWNVGGSDSMIAGGPVPYVMNIGLRKWASAKGVSLHDHSVVVVTVAKVLGVFSAR